MIVFRQWAWSFLGVVIESMPFVLIGALISGAIQIYMSEDIIKRILPKNNMIAIFIASIVGFVLPMCECAIVPVTRSLIKKGLPVSVAITFMLSVPIVNPLVIMSTYYAFENTDIVILRVICGIIGSIIIGAIIGFIYDKKKVTEVISDSFTNSICTCCNDNNYNPCKKTFSNYINHASSEFLNISVYVIIGALISSAFGILINERIIARFAFTPAISILVMLVLSFVLSLCSEADAFVAKGFLNNFGLASVTGFMLLGPMMDFKNFILTLGLFKKKFSYILLAVITAVVITISFALNIIIV